MKRLVLLLASALLGLAAIAASAQAAPGEYGIETLSGALSSAQAGEHADFTTSFVLNNEKGKPFGQSAKLVFHVPPGLAGNVAAFPKCTAAELLTSVRFTTPAEESEICPIDSQVGFTEVTISSLYGEGATTTYPEPVYNMVPGPGEAARFGFVANVVPTLIDVRLDPASGYGLTATLESLSSVALVYAAKTTLWGNPTDPSHDPLRVTPYEVSACEARPCTAPGKEPRHTSLLPTAFMSNPTSCEAPLGLAMFAESYETISDEREVPLLPRIGGCGALDLQPTFSLVPTTSQAETGTGLDVELTFPQEGLRHPNLLAESHLKRAEVTLPEGVTVNPSEASGGLGVCSEEDLANETATSAPNVGCPETSKIGTVTAKSPLLDEAAEGGLFLAKPYANPFGSLLAVYMVFKIPARGVIVKQPLRVEPDPRTGRIVTVAEDIPQLPISSFKLHFREGARAPLVTPPTCGTYRTIAKFTPWSAPEEVFERTATFTIDRGVNGGPCPSGGTPPFEPGFSAGALNNNAASFSPYYMRLTRRDGNQDLTRFSTTLPPGALAKLAGVSQCPQALIEAAKAKTGIEERESPSCPQSSEIGRVMAGAGVGQVLTYVPGKIYLSGPYHGAPISITAIVPAVAGPFDVGTVVTQEALTLDPETGQARVDGSRSDPIPHILAGIPLKVRDIRVYVDRPNFTINPTSCEPLAFGAQLWGGGADVFSSADDSPVSLTQRFQAANCSLLGFKPKLAIKLSGGTKRGDFPALKAVVTPRPGDANFAKAVVTLPHSAFLEQGHIRTICTRVQFASGGGNGEGCPAGAVYGKAKAWSPLLDEALEGPVFLRSSSHNLPDLVAALHGLVNIDLDGRIDSVHGGIRSTFEAIPDAPVSRFVLEMQGGQKGLIVNSTDLCSGVHRATADLSGQNGRTLLERPQVRPLACARHRSHRAKRRR